MRRLRVLLTGLGVLVAAMVVASSEGALGSERLRPYASEASLRVTGPEMRPLDVKEHIDALTQDGSRIAWIAGSPCSWKIETWNLGTGARATLAPLEDLWYEGCSEGFTLERNSEPWTPAFALAGTRVLWGAFDEWGNSGMGGFVTAAPGERPTQLEGLIWEDYFWGDYMTGAAGDGPTLLYSTLKVDVLTDDLDACVRGPCVFSVREGSVKRVVGRKARVLPFAARPAAIAVSGTRVAIVPVGGPYRCAKKCSAWPGPRAKPNGMVEIRNVTTGALIASFAPKGVTKAIALAPRLVAVLLQQGPSRRIERYDAATGAFIGSTPVPSTVAPVLAIAGSRIVYRVGKAISLLDATSGKTRLLRMAGATPVGLSTDGRRVVWAENLSARRARIQIVIAP